MPQNTELEKKLEKKAEKEDRQKKNLTVFGQETEFDGELEFTDNLVITGKFSGKINATGNLEIDKTALCNVDSIKVNSLVISGKVKGNIEAKERVEMCSGSSVAGDVVTGRIRIADNVDFEGSVKMIQDPPEVDLFSVASDEFKQALLIKSDLPH
ncbi:polymer-forming cytoskeletal protein [Treponema berlinense]|uniref:bactofilin family protein n=1 Tax=Treponema berlinense TaxID=225004 RepID=UPI0026F3627B|nr:polymer-forming cytoskeletal protein [Treponema berlinense]